MRIRQNEKLNNGRELIFLTKIIISAGNKN